MFVKILMLLMVLAVTIIDQGLTYSENDDNGLGIIFLSSIRTNPKETIMHKLFMKPNTKISCI